MLIGSGGVWNIPYSLRVLPPLETEANKTTIDDISNMEGYIIKGPSSNDTTIICLLYTSQSTRDSQNSRIPS